MLTVILTTRSRVQGSEMAQSHTELNAARSESKHVTARIVPAPDQFRVAVFSAITNCSGLNRTTRILEELLRAEANSLSLIHI